MARKVKNKQDRLKGGCLKVVLDVRNKPRNKQGPLQFDEIWSKKYLPKEEKEIMEN